MNSNRTWATTLLLIAVLSPVALGLFTVHCDALGSETAIGLFVSLVSTGVLSLFASVQQGRRDPPETTPQVSIPGLIRVRPKTQVVGLFFRGNEFIGEHFEDAFAERV